MGEETTRCSLHFCVWIFLPAPCFLKYKNSLGPIYLLNISLSSRDWHPETDDPSFVYTKQHVQILLLLQIVKISILLYFVPCWPAFVMLYFFCLIRSCQDREPMCAPSYLTPHGPGAPTVSPAVEIPEAFEKSFLTGCCLVFEVL